MAYKDSIYTDQDQDMLLNNLNLELHEVDRDPWHYVMTWLATIAVTFSTGSHIYGKLTVFEAFKWTSTVTLSDL